MMALLLVMSMLLVRLNSYKYFILYFLDVLSELKDLTNLQVLDLCANRFNGSLSVQGSSKLLSIQYILLG